MKKQRIGLHKIAMAALFTVGTVLIRYPWGQSDGGIIFLFFLLAMGALIPPFVFYPLFRNLWRKPLSVNRGKRWLVAIFSILFGAYAIYCGWKGCRDYVDFSMRLVLPQGSRLLLTVAFLWCASRMSALRDRSMDSFSLLGVGVALLCVAILFLMGIPHFRWEYADASLFQWNADAWKKFSSLWLESLLPLTVLALYFALTVPRGGERALALGTGVGCGLLFFCVAQAILTFGAAYASELAYPYSYSARILSVGPYFFRLEGISYLFDYLTCLWRCGISLAVVRRLLARFYPRLGKYVPICLFVLLAAFFLIQ